MRPFAKTRGVAIWGLLTFILVSVNACQMELAKETTPPTTERQTSVPVSTSEAKDESFVPTSTRVALTPPYPLSRDDVYDVEKDGVHTAVLRERMTFDWADLKRCAKTAEIKSGGEVDEAFYDPTVSPSAYLLRVFYDLQTVVAYQADSQGRLTIVRSMPCSTARQDSDEFYRVKRVVHRLVSDGRWRRFSALGESFHQFTTHIQGDYFFHSVAYSEAGDNVYRDHAFAWDQYDALGTRASHGCIRLTVGDAHFIYMNASRVAKVEFLPSSLGYGVRKVFAPKRTSDRDPTDSFIQDEETSASFDCKATAPSPIEVRRRRAS